MVGAERHVPYERPPLSKERLRGETDETGALHPEAWYEENEIRLRLGIRAIRVDPQGRTLVLEDGETIPFDRILIATGGRNRRLAIPGRELEGIFELRTIEDSEGIRQAASAGRRAVVIGAGFIGTEVAASLRARGCDVEVVEMLETTLARALGPEIGRVYEGIHRDHGVRLRFGETVERFEGDGRVERVVTSRGDRIECDLVVVGIGLEPNIDVIEGSGVTIQDGIVVDQYCRTSVDGIYAAGDVANHFHPLFDRRMRVEHWDNALKQGAAAALNMMGRPTPFEDPHWFWSDQYEHNLQSIGQALDWDRVVVRGKIGDRRFVAFYMKDGLVEQVVGVDMGKDVRRARGLVTSRRPVDEKNLLDEDVDLKSLAASLGTAGKGVAG